MTDTPPDLTVTRSDTPNGRRYEARLPDIDRPAIVTARVPDAGTLVIDHTEVPPAARGQGIGFAIVDHVVQEARSEGREIVPLCPFVRTKAAGTPSWSDVVQS